MNISADELRARFPNISADVLRRSASAGPTDIHVDSPRPAAVMERHSGDGAVGEIPIQGGLGKRFFVRVTAIRRRLIDQDNLCEKYHVDLLRYASGGLFGDSPATTRIEVTQQKAGKGEPEEVRIEVFEE